MPTKLSKIYIFGNPDLEFDSFPLRILPELKRRFPKIDFEIKDPNEEWESAQNPVIIDTVHGIARVKIFSSLDEFTDAPRVSLHDFDALTNLKFLKKLGKIEEIKIIGVPPTLSEKEALENVASILASLF